MSYEDKVTFHSLDVLCALEVEDEREHQAAADRIAAAGVDPVHIAVHLAGMLKSFMNAGESEAWALYIFDQREKARLIAAADLPSEDGSPFSNY
ncbi:hypothetical protein [Microbacterium sp. WCS2018Hpa-9]|uniref:hypothetical protein n=1 Tax=Microbacterium sp. WCS2018Hpa-9 TaxID=3073635 RepID=UPI0028896221|nr:hypothetical protein [Microbacterium sp. WCS2018Hpa-9]